MQQPKQYIFKIVLTGPESSGKTALAAALAQALGTSWVPEFARYYLSGLGRPYQREDLCTIGRGQAAWEAWYTSQSGEILICDTDWTVLQIWEHYRFGRPVTGNWDWQKGYQGAKIADHYLLCAPDFPWQPDPLREHPEERETLFEWYEHLLMESNANYTVMRGHISGRLEQAASLVHKLLRPL